MKVSIVEEWEVVQHFLGTLTHVEDGVAHYIMIGVRYWESTSDTFTARRSRRD